MLHGGGDSPYNAVSRALDCPKRKSIQANGRSVLAPEVEKGREANARSVEDDAQLMREMAARNVAAFEVLYDRYHQLVYGIALRMLADSSAAEDATQSVFLKVWSAPEGFRGGNFAAWLGRVTRNGCLDSLRARSRRPVAPLFEMPADDHVEDSAFAHIDAAAMYAALTQLPSDQRELIELCFFGGMTQQAIAERTSVPLGTVKTRIRSGLHKLRAALIGSEQA